MMSTTWNAFLLLALGGVAHTTPATPATSEASEARQDPQASQSSPVQELPPLPDATPAALARWQAVLAASRTGEGNPKPIRAFLLNAEVLTRNGVKTNEFDVE